MRTGREFKCVVTRSSSWSWLAEQICEKLSPHSEGKYLLLGENGMFKASIQTSKTNRSGERNHPKEECHSSEVPSRFWGQTWIRFASPGWENISNDNRLFFKFLGNRFLRKHLIINCHSQAERTDVLVWHLDGVYHRS